MRHFDRAGRDGLPQRILGDVVLGVLFSKTGELSKLLGPKEPEDRYLIDISYSDRDKEVYRWGHLR